MKKFLMKVLPGAAVISAMLLSAAVWSMGPGGGMGHDPGRMVAHMTDRLDLSQEQQAQVEALLRESREKSSADHQRLRDLREELKAQRGNFDAGQVQRTADEIGQITGRMVYESASTHAAIYQLLTDEQKAEMDALMERHKAHRGKWRKGMREHHD